MAAAAAEGTHVDALFDSDEEPGESYAFAGEGVREHEVTTCRVRFEITLSVDFGDEVLVVGDAENLGSWSLSKAKKLSWHEGDVWSAEIDLPEGEKIEYKYAITSHDHEDAKWMPGKNFALCATPDCERRDQWGVESLPAEKEADIPHKHQISSAEKATEEDWHFGNLEKKTVKEIKSILKAKGLPVSGKKADLIERLRSLCP